MTALTVSPLTSTTSLTWSTVPQVHPVVRPDLQSFAPTTAAVAPRTETGVPAEGAPRPPPQTATEGLGVHEGSTAMRAESTPLPNCAGTADTGLPSVAPSAEAGSAGLDCTTALADDPGNAVPSRQWPAVASWGAPPDFSRPLNPTEQST